MEDLIDIVTGQIQCEVIRVDPECLGRVLGSPASFPPNIPNQAVVFYQLDLKRNAYLQGRWLLSLLPR